MGKSEPKNSTVVAIELVLLALGPPLAFGLGVAAVGGWDTFVAGALVGGVIGISAASLRRELHGMGGGD
ncbi:hypothetical protein [Halostagnicola sp. A-GB9-2]|uniref:hypothetical protein n=1 Tax=Halostagnicola sp. A-GB9-2 TaxID=3048066 RepID=UPI0024BFF848|nr:hypothetical protein [Halostagnicola sp. A-GB9-2]MDJ1430946.1 hypothetical protein [Halostagnicola sp. A-GB9-2]